MNIFLAAVLTGTCVAAPPGRGDPKAAAVGEPRETCPCTNPLFRPITKRARAVADYWKARSDWENKKIFAEGSALASLLGGFTGYNDAQNDFSAAQAEMISKRETAKKLGGVRVVGDDPHAYVKVTLEKDVDYVFDPPLLEAASQ